MKVSQLSDEQLQQEFVKVQQRYNNLIHLATSIERQQGPLVELRQQLNKILEEFRRRKIK